MSLEYDKYLEQHRANALKDILAKMKQKNGGLVTYDPFGQRNRTPAWV